MLLPLEGRIPITSNKHSRAFTASKNLEMAEVMQIKHCTGCLDSLHFLRERGAFAEPFGMH